MTVLALEQGMYNVVYKIPLTVVQMYMYTNMYTYICMGGISQKIKTPVFIFPVILHEKNKIFFSCVFMDNVNEFA